MTRSWVFLSRRTERRQGVQRLWKALHRDDPKPVGVLPGLYGVVPSGDEECVHTRFARTYRFLLDPTDREDRAVRLELAGGRDPVAMDDVAAELLHHLE